MQNNTDTMTLQKCLFCTVKVPVLRCNIGSFATQNNPYCKALITNTLHHITDIAVRLHLFTLFTPFLSIH